MGSVRARRSARRLVAGLGTVGVSVALVGAFSTPAMARPAPWPAHPNWQQYVQAPSSTNVTPVSIVSTAGSVCNAPALLHPRPGQSTTLTATPLTVTSSPVTITLPAVPSRYVRVDVTRLGLPPAGDPAGLYVQLAELQVFDNSSTDLALGRPVTASETIETAGWSTHNLTDGVTDSQDAAAHGYTSQAHSSSDVSAAPIWVTVDLGSVQPVSRVVLWPRTDTLSPDGRTASFPVDYSVGTSATDDQPSSFTIGKTVVGQADPPVPVQHGGPASIILDYGHEVGGYPTFDVSQVSGGPRLQAGYSETRTQISPTGDGVSPWASGDPQRYDSYRVTTPGRITNAQIQGGERYEQITLTTPGTVSLTAAAIQFTPYLARPSDYAGYFVSSSDELNRYWYDGAYTAEVNQTPVGTVGPRWNTDAGFLDVPGTTAGTGVLTSGTGWTDYTVSFRTRIVSNQAGWMVRGQDAQHGYLFILDSADDTAGTPNQLQVLAQSGSNYRPITNVALTNPIAPGSWHSVRQVVSGGTVTTFIDGSQVSSFADSTYATGSFGIREYTGEQADFADLSVVGPTGTVLYRNSLAKASAINDFAVPGQNAVPLILDGAKRDRAVWSGDLAVEGPTLFYSTNTSDYIRGSLELLGSYAGSNGYVSGDMPPQTPINTAAPGDPQNAYSASYSMYFVRDLAEYYRYTGDAAFVRQEWPIVAWELAWSAAQVDANGLFATTEADGADWDYYDGNKTGEVTAYNALYYQTLLDGAELAPAAGQSSLSKGYLASASALKSAINGRLFNPATGVYDLSDSVRGTVAQDANVLAIDFGIAPPDKVSGILAAVKSALWTSSGPLPFSSGYQKTISPFVSGFELSARFGAGDTANALQLLSNEWGPMIAPGDLYTGTFWENESTSGTQATGQTSMAHGWSSSPTSALSQYVLGISPVTAGYRTWLVQPHPGNLAWTEGRSPTRYGPLVVDWGHASNGSFAMHVSAPKGTSGTIAVPVSDSNIAVQVNGRTVWRHGRAAGHTFAPSLQGDYLNLTVGAGSYDIATSAA